ncbi:Cytosolic Fe-S cluster assembly factor nubp2 [Hypsibius exemplaris]|uniref:Cytosolic Fe-S cluster assembly factor NUBP2 homolog n=1 Tax=Hypsibius exemplaris TaxID=2072580 RepID=A0A1W0X1V6_HYPEX|nr:Cytosolic Fe-S cluster assembly factor nubp2 [Hypsibius exemplaris]
MDGSGDKISHLRQVKHIIVVLSGKGGVGKSTVTVELALTLRAAGKKVGILDIDLCGPSIPRMLGAGDQRVHQSSDGWVPIYPGNDKSVGLMSIGFLLSNPDEAVVWRGPKKNALIKQLLDDVYWDNIDYLLIDTPPGTSDEHITVVEALRDYNPDGSILVTTPQAVSTADVRREITFCRKAALPILGIIENMSGYVCPNCEECTNIFSSGGGKGLADEFGIPFLGCVPIDPELTKTLEQGQNFVEAFPNSKVARIFSDVVANVIRVCENQPTP